MSDARPPWWGDDPDAPSSSPASSDPPDLSTSSPAAEEASGAGGTAGPRRPVFRRGERVDPEVSAPREEGRERFWRRDEPSHALPAATGPGARRGFGTTWWGKAWLDALEHQARLDPNRLGRGKSYARRGSVREHTIEPGLVTASVQGSRLKPYQVTVTTNVFTDADWDAVADIVSAQVGRVAALLDGELPPEVVDDVRSAGLELLPAAGDIRLACTCPDHANPCKHAAAVCYLLADELDADPFTLLQLRGRGRSELLAALRHRRAASAPGEGAPRRKRVSGVPAKKAYARTDRPDIPRAPLPPAKPGVPAVVLALDPPPGIDAHGLVALATDAARRAWELASGDGDGGLSLTRGEDLARHAARLLGTTGLADLAHRAGIPSRTLTSWALAWRVAGAPGLAVTREPVEVDPEAMAEARDALAAADPDTPVSVRGNRATSGRTQLRLGADDLWYLFDKQFNDWTLTRPGAASPDAQLSGR